MWDQHWISSTIPRSRLKCPKQRVTRENPWSPFGCLTCTHSGGVLLDTLQMKPVRLLWFEWYPSFEGPWYLKNYAGEILVGLFYVFLIWRLEIGDRENLSYRTCPTQKWKRASQPGQMSMASAVSAMPRKLWGTWRAEWVPAGCAGGRVMGVEGREAPKRRWGLSRNLKGEEVGVGGRERMEWNRKAFRGEGTAFLKAQSWETAWHIGETVIVLHSPK